MATFSKRGRNQWQAKIRRKGYPEQSKTFDSKEEAEAWARQVEGEMDKGMFVNRAEAERTTLLEALERYLREVSITKRGHEEESYRIRAWMRHPLALRSIAAIRASDMALYRDERLKVVKPATVRLELAVLSHLYSIAVKEWGLPVINPVSNIRLPVPNNVRDRRLEDGEEQYLLAAMDSPAGDRSNPWIKPIVIIAIETAMRQSEILNARWEHANLAKRTLHIPKTKNGDPRTVPLSTVAVETLAALPRAIDGRVFPTSESALKQSWSRAKSRAKGLYQADCMASNALPDHNFMEDLRFHDLRHEATSRLATKLTLNELMKTTGHKDVRMLARYYHPRAEELALKLA